MVDSYLASCALGAYVYGSVSLYFFQGQPVGNNPIHIKGSDRIMGAIRYHPKHPKLCNDGTRYLHGDILPYAQFSCNGGLDNLEWSAVRCVYSVVSSFHVRFHRKSNERPKST